MNSPELLAPAGNYDCIRAACDHGADAVYVGIGPYNLRAHSANFSVEELSEAVLYVRSCNRLIYAALNTMPNDRMLGEIELLVCALAAQETLPDAFIVSDPGVVTVCQKYLPQIPLHLSTQTGTFNSASAAFWKQHGVTRVVLPREMSLEEITAFTAASSVETEVFVHGAMCVSISGRCLLGAYLSGRHPNRGDCPQPCRLKYRITPDDAEMPDTNGEWLSVEETGPDEPSAYILNSKDLNTLSILPQIVASGVSSLKIEGRNKSAHYVASVVKVYREAIDICCSKSELYNVKQAWIDELDRVDHRTYTTGFYAGEYNLQEPDISHTRSDLRVVGTVKGLMINGDALVDVKNPFSSGDTLNVLPVKQGAAPYDVGISHISDINGNALPRALTNRIVVAATTMPLRVGDMLRKKDSSRKSPAPQP
jgi:U32 family peptidase